MEQGPSRTSCDCFGTMSHHIGATFVRTDCAASVCHSPARYKLLDVENLQLLDPSLSQVQWSRRRPLLILIEHEKCGLRATFHDL